METMEAIMPIQKIADRLVDYCRKGEDDIAHRELYSDDAESIEPAHTPSPQTAKGREAIEEKGKRFQSMVEKIHSITVSNPVIAGDQFAVAIEMDATMKGEGRSKMTEIAVYKVQNGKVVKEQFIY